MSASATDHRTRAEVGDPSGGSVPLRRFTETKASFKTSEFFAMIAIVVGILISAAAISASAGHPDRFTASQAWLYVSIVAVGYMMSRGLAKSGSREPYPDDRS
ncbi:MAG: sle [Solirubrobacterales bacterium]|jgi:hypothetical protein|nr:sle [Solirubrobacterales bacterium]